MVLEINILYCLYTIWNPQTQFILINFKKWFQDLLKGVQVQLDKQLKKKKKKIPQTDK